jgi:cysteine synthase A
VSVVERIGNTPLVEIEGVYVKLECANPGGSVKDRIARYMLEAARARGELEPGDTIVEATSGNTGIALAWIGRMLGHPVLIFMPEHMSIERLHMLEQLGAKVELTPRAESFAGAVARRDAYRGKPGHWVPDQFGNPDNTRCHRDTTGVELIAQVRAKGVRRLDWFVAGIGTGGTLMGVGEALREAMPGVRLAAVEPEESAVLSGGPAGDHGIMGIGDGFIPDLVDRAAIDEVVRVSTAEAHTAASRLRIQHGYCVGISAGANMVAALRLKGRGGSVATVWPDCSDRYVSMGLGGAGTGEVRCPLKSFCEARSRAMLGHELVIEPGAESGGPHS